MKMSSAPRPLSDGREVTGMAEAADAPTATQPLAPDELELLNAYWRAANYLAVGQIYCSTTRSSASRCSRSTSSRGCAATSALCRA